MADWLVAAIVGAIAAGLQYGRLQVPSRGKRAGLALLRASALALLVALLMNAPLGRPRPVLPGLFVDASQSMTRGGSGLWAAAWDSAAAVRAESTWIFGDSVRLGRGGTEGADAGTSVRAVVERTMSSGQPAILITDGEVRDSTALDGLSSGSRIVVLPRPAQRDVGIVDMDAPRAAVQGDSISVRVTLAAASQGASAGEVVLQLGDETLGRWTLDAMSTYGERQIDMRARVNVREGLSVLRAIVTSAGDSERRNDTLAAGMEISRAASAVFVSTSPDQDARFAIAVLRGALALPTRGFLRIAPGMWRVEGSLAPVSEPEVRQALRDAPVAILHGDTAIFGPPHSVTVGPLALLVPADTEDDEWYPSRLPASPLSGVLASFPLESLPPVSVGAAAAGDWVALEARRGREVARRAVVVGRDAPRRVVTVTGSGFWRWRFRGGASADAYAALWGGVFDWLAAERADRRGAVPEDNVLRAGERVRWRRGSSSDTAVRVALTAPAGRSDTIVLRFAPGSAVMETDPLPVGIYTATVPGGRTTLVVNHSAELLPARPQLRSGSVGRRARPDDARGARRAPWLYALIVALLCAEWFARRRAGLR